MRLVKKSLGAAMAASLPQIEVLATGGTIAGSGNSATGSAYTAGKVSRDICQNIISNGK